MDAVAIVAPDSSFLADQVIGAVSAFSVSEEATPVVPGDSSGGTPTLSITGVALDRWALATDEDLTLITEKGSATGTITDVDLSSASDTVTLGVSTLLNRLNIDVRALPYFTVVGNVVSDGFLRPNDPTHLGVPPTGQPWAVLRGVWGILGNQAYSTSTAGRALAGVLLPTSNHEVRVTVAAIGTTGPTAGLTVRMSDADNYYWADYSATGAWRLGKSVAGVQTILRSGTGISIGSSLTLRIQGNGLTLSANATQLATLVDNTLPTGSWAGIISNGTVGSVVTRWDDFTVTDTSPVATNLYNGFTNLTRLAGISDDQVEVDPEIQYDSVIFPGFVGNLWDHIKQFCSAHGYQCYSANGKIGLTRIGKIVIEAKIPNTASTSISMGDVAQQVQITNHQYTSTAQGVFFKADQVYSLEAGETQEISVKVKGTPGALNDPVCVSGMDLKTTSGPGQYVVTGEDGYIMAPALWNDLGGRITARLSEEAADEIVLVLTAPEDKTRAPYRISEGDDRPALWVTGAGVLSDPKVVTIYTGADRAPQVTVDPVENVFVANRNMAYTAGARLAGSYSGPSVVVSLSGVPDLVLTRLGFTYTVPPLATQFRVLEEELAVWFGSLAGAILPYGEGVYRVTAATVSEGGVDLTLTQHTTFADFDTVWAGKTFGNFDGAMGTDIQFGHWNIFPLALGV